jgi:hypothetical protein
MIIAGVATTSALVALMSCLLLLGPLLGLVPFSPLRFGDPPAGAIALAGGSPKAAPSRGASAGSTGERDVPRIGLADPSPAGVLLGSPPSRRPPTLTGPARPGRHAPRLLGSPKTGIPAVTPATPSPTPSSAADVVASTPVVSPAPAAGGGAVAGSKLPGAAVATSASGALTEGRDGDHSSLTGSEEDGGDEVKQGAAEHQASHGEDLSRRKASHGEDVSRRAGRQQRKGGSQSQGGPQRNGMSSAVTPAAPPVAPAPEAAPPAGDRHGGPAWAPPDAGHDGWHGGDHHGHGRGER